MKGGGSGFGSGRFVLAVNYTISAKETKYKGTWFRSRLEARWAAFFDLVGLEYHYEPFDLPGWSPDFLIQTDFTYLGYGVVNWLLEVKPLLAPEAALFSKMYAALAAGDAENTYAPVLVGLAPRFANGRSTPYIAWEEKYCETPDGWPLHCFATGDAWDKRTCNYERHHWENLWGEAHNLSRFWKPKP